MKDSKSNTALWMQIDNQSRRKKMELKKILIKGT